MSVRPYEISVSWNKEFTLRKRNGNCFHTFSVGFVATLGKALENLSEISDMDVSYDYEEYIILATGIGNERIITIYDKLEEETFSFACRNEQLLNESVKLINAVKSVN